PPHDGAEAGVRIKRVGVAVRYSDVVASLALLEDVVGAPLSEWHLAPADVCQPALIHIEAYRPDAARGESQGQRQANPSQAHYAEREIAAPDLLSKINCFQ